LVNPDFWLTPERFTPAYEKRLSRRALGVVYAAFAIGARRNRSIAAAATLTARR
jgi:hypothetical protein